MKTYLQSTLEELGRYVVPILTIRRRTQSPYLIGSGVLYQSDIDTFLITAKHVIDDLKDGKIVTSGYDGFIQFNAEMAAYEYEEGRGRDRDICVIRIPSEVMKNIHRSFISIDKTRISNIESYDKLTLYAFVGYPHSRNKPKPKEFVKIIELKPVNYVTREFLDIKKIPSKDKYPALHVAFSFPFKKAKDVNLVKRIYPPKPWGISGCGVWKIKLDSETGQVQQPDLVAIGIEYWERENAFVATRIYSPLMAIYQLKEMLNNGM